MRMPFSLERYINIAFISGGAAWQKKMDKTTNRRVHAGRMLLSGKCTTEAAKAVAFAYLAMLYKQGDNSSCALTLTFRDNPPQPHLAWPVFGVYWRLRE